MIGCGGFLQFSVHPGTAPDLPSNSFHPRALRGVVTPSVQSAAGLPAEGTARPIPRLA